MCPLLSAISLTSLLINLEGCVLHSLRFSLTFSPHPSWWNCPLLSSIFFDLLSSSILMELSFTLFDSLWPPLLLHLDGIVLYSLRFSPIHLEGCALYSLRFSLTSPLIYQEGCVHCCLRSLWPFLLIHLEGFVLYSIRLSFTSPSHPSWSPCHLLSLILFDLPPHLLRGMCPLLSAISLTSPPHLSRGMCSSLSSILFDLPSSIH